jgi:ribosomal protein S12 methylthiotransferase accessory factor
VTFGYNSSIRARAIAETLQHARAIAARLGITRVTDTTRLDRAGVPVFASIRPSADVGSLCVNAGKGLTVEEAQIGAYMESIEIAFAEPSRTPLPIIHATGHQVRASGYPLIDFMPRDFTGIDEDRAIPCVEADDLVHQRRCLVPAERVLFPYPSSYFTSDTNGLASGNTVLEATVHGLCEVIERDITSFGSLLRWHHVRPESMPPALAQIATRVADVGLQLIVRVIDNEYDLPFFNSIVREPDLRDALHMGYGCHPWRNIAATRAVTECFQERLTIIHGGRDSLQRLREQTIKEPQHVGAKHAFGEQLARQPCTHSFADVVDWSEQMPSLDALYDALVARVVPISGGILRVTLTPPDSPIHVVKVIVPRMEFYVQERMYAGERLRAAQRAAGVNARSNASD